MKTRRLLKTGWWLMLMIGVSIAQSSKPGEPVSLAPPKPKLLAVSFPDLSDGSSLSALEPRAKEHLLSVQRSAAARLNQAANDQQLSEAYGLLGRTYHAYSLALPAEQCYRNARSLSPRDYRWAYLLGVIFQSDGRTAAALAAFQQVQQFNPQYLAASVNQGNLYLQLNQLDEAVAAFKAVLALNAESAAAHYGLGRAALTRQRYTEAVTHFERALALLPEANRIHYPLAQAYRELGQIEKAKAHLALRGEVGVRVADPLFDGLRELVQGERLHLARGKQAFDAQRYADAVAAYRQAIAAQPQSVTAHVNLGSALAQLRDAEAARSAFEAALKLDAANALAHYNLALLSAKASRHEEAVTHLRAALKSNPQDAEARALLAAQLALSARTDEALAEWSQLADAGNEDALLEEVKLLWRGKEFRRALMRLEQSQQQFPARGRTMITLAYSLATCAQTDLRNGARAYELAEQVYRTTKSVTHGAVVALALAELGRCDEAAAWQRRLLAEAERDNNSALAAKLKNDLRRFEAGKLCRYVE